MRESCALINDPVQSQARLFDHSSSWGSFMTEDMIPEDALFQQ